MGRFLVWALRWCHSDPRFVVFLPKFMVVLSIVLGASVGLLAVGNLVAGPWGGVLLMTSPMWLGLWRIRKRRQQEFPTARSLPARPAAER